MKKLLFAAMLVILASCNYTEKESTSATSTEVSTDSVAYIKITYVYIYNNRKASAVEYATESREKVNLAKSKIDSIFIANIPVVDSVFSTNYNCYVKRVTNIKYNIYIK